MEMALGAARAAREFAELRRYPDPAGENVSTLMDFRCLLAAKAVDFVEPGPAKMGV
jgi:hypothetical protein